MKKSEVENKMLLYNPWFYTSVITVGWSFFILNNHHEWICKLAMKKKDKEREVVKGLYRLKQKEATLIKKEDKIKQHIEGLHKQTENLEKLHHHVNKKHEEVKTNAKDIEDVRKVLKIADDLLGYLPEKTIEKIAETKEFHVYRDILDKYHIK